MIHKNTQMKIKMNFVNFAEILNLVHSMLRHVRTYCKIKKEMDAEEAKKDLIIMEQKEQINKLIDKVGNKTNLTNSILIIIVIIILIIVITMFN